MKPVKKKLMDYLLAALLIYLLVMALTFFIQRSFMYFPDTARQDPALFQASNMDIINVTTADGLSLQGWYQAPQDQEKPVIVFFHGNGSHMGLSALKTSQMRAQGYGAMLIAYRGYAGNEGKPSEKGLYKDARAFIDWVINEQNIPQERLVLYGESLGSGVAVEMAVNDYPDIAGVILEAPYTSFIEMARRTHFWLPLDLLMRDRYETIDKIANVKAPILVLHGKRDMIVPYRFGKEVFEAAPEPKIMKTYKEAGHNDQFMHGASDDILTWLDTL